jgi:hypothetical protein
MGEDEPFRGDEEIEPTKVSLKGPNVVSTFDTPPKPDALRAQKAAVRRYLKHRRSEGDPPDTRQA